MGNCLTCFKEPNQTALEDTVNHKDKEEMSEARLYPAPSHHAAARSAANEIRLDNGNHLPTAPPDSTLTATLTSSATLTRPAVVANARKSHPKVVLTMGVAESKPSEAKLAALFDRYRDPCEDAEEEDAILAEGIEQLCRDLQVPPDDFAVLVLAWKLGAQRMCRFTRTEFVSGLRAMRADSVKAIQTRLPEVICELERDRDLFRDLYRFTFRFGLDSAEGQRILPADIAQVLWKLVFTIREPPILDRWLSFLDTHQSIRGIPKDTWNMFLNFSEHVGNDLSCYDDNEAWPSLFDDFVEFENDQANQNVSKEMEKEREEFIIAEN
ncbi:unnamed protein product [Phaedon cochleariae]|uniref:Defective in cullin neddylation protein n=1 Tax=Phaedon cochleariae TaxID=80249 RepID=A0A9N9SFC3_PHACE|nr:unnamed protein product [Phaedon cochleariae]